VHRPVIARKKLENPLREWKKIKSKRCPHTGWGKTQEIFERGPSGIAGKKGNMRGACVTRGQNKKRIQTRNKVQAGHFQADGSETKATMAISAGPERATPVGGD